MVWYKNLSHGSLIELPILFVILAQKKPMVCIKKVSDYQYALGIKGQGRIYLKPAYGLYYELLHFLIKGDYIWHNDWLWRVD